MNTLCLDEVLCLINTELIYKPGWSFEATDHTKRFQDCVKVKIHYPAYNSDREEARKGYPTSIVTYAVFPLVFGDCATRDDVLARLLGAILSIEMHEAREFLRLPAEDFEAPFHPHRHQEMDRWARVECNLNRLDDLQFGTA